MYDFRLEELLGPHPADPIPKVRFQSLPEYCPKGDNGKAKRRRCNVCWTPTIIVFSVLGALGVVFNHALEYFTQNIFLFYIKYKNKIIPILLGLRWTHQTRLWTPTIVWHVTCAHNAPGAFLFFIKKNVKCCNGIHFKPQYPHNIFYRYKNCINLAFPMLFKISYRRNILVLTHYFL